MSSSAPPRPTLLTRPMLLLCSASFGAMICFYLLLSVVPQYATSIGATGIGAGLATGALMLSTVALEIAIRAVGLKGEVIIPSYTFVATAHALQRQFRKSNDCRHTRTSSSARVSLPARCRMG